MTAPTAGDTVQFRTSPDDQPVDATVITVRTNGMVDLQVGGTRMDAIAFIQAGGDPPRFGGYAAWSESEGA